MGKRRDKTEHIAQLLHGGQLPVVAVATAAHGPGDERWRGRRMIYPTHVTGTLPSLSMGEVGRRRVRGGLTTGKLAKDDSILNA